MDDYEKLILFILMSFSIKLILDGENFHAIVNEVIWKFESC